MRLIVQNVEGADWNNPDSVHEAISTLNAVVQDVRDTDALVHAGDAKVWDNVIEDLKAENHLDALPKLINSGVGKLKATNLDAYYDLLKVSTLEALDEVGVGQALNNVWAALNSGKIEDAKAAIKSIAQWMNDIRKDTDKLRSQQSESSKISEERQRWETERATKEFKDFQTSAATQAEKHNNLTLGRALSSYLKLPFFKELTLPAKQDLGRGIKAELYERLENNKVYQKQMQLLFKGKNKDGILSYHQQTLDSIAEDVVKSVIERRYPHWAKGGSVAARAATAKAKAAAGTKASHQSIATMKPIYVATRPTDLIREDITAGGKTYTAADLTMMQIAGKGFVRSKDGRSLRLVTWRKH
jgi:hypothetical protein